jgi:hypothetical protein
MKLALDRIVNDPRIYPREKINPFHVNRLRLAFEAGAKFPSPVIETGTNRLVDGWHRVEMWRQQGITEIVVTVKSYASEADLFADAVRLNIGHGEALDGYSVKNAIIRLQEYGFERDKISEIVRLPIARIDDIERGFAYAASSSKSATVASPGAAPSEPAEPPRPIALKGGLDHLGGCKLTERQIEVNKHYAGPKAVFFVRQICDLLVNDMWPDTPTFCGEMDRLVGLWERVRTKKADAA